MAFNVFHKAALAAALSAGLGGMALAQTQATSPSPATTTAPAGDTTGTMKSGAMQTAPAGTTGTDKASTPGTAMSNTTSMTKAHGQLMADQKFTTATAASAHCPSDTVVWATMSKSHAYHMSSSKYYGKTKHGAYVCKMDADAAGFHATKQ